MACAVSPISSSLLCLAWARTRTQFRPRATPPRTPDCVISNGTESIIFQQKVPRWRAANVNGCSSSARARQGRGTSRGLRLWSVGCRWREKKETKKPKNGWE